jgi:Fe-S oxidoreductase
MPFNPEAKDFADPAVVDREFRRQMDVCHTCRRCYNLCPSFDVIFRALDRSEVDGEIERVPGKDLKAFTDLCYECKLCIPHCPYYPPHRWDIDIPRLVLRARATRVREAGKPPLRDRVLGSADALGELASLAAPAVNAANRNTVVRFAMEKALGVHRRRLLPTFCSETFGRWWNKRGGATLLSGAGSGEAVVLFVTCSVNFNNPRIGKAAVAVLEKNGVEVFVPPQKCCGMPFLDSGDLESARENRRLNVNSLLPFVRAGMPVVTTGPTCSLTLRKEYPLLGDDPESGEVARATWDLSEYLMMRHAKGRLKTDFVRSAGKIAYHLSCHLKVQDIGFKSSDLLAAIPGTEVQMVEKCSGHDGTWSMKKEFFETSIRIGEPLFEQLRASPGSAIATDCPLAGIQIQQGTQRAPRHPIEVLAECYGLEV